MPNITYLNAFCRNAHPKRRMNFVGYDFAGNDHVIEPRYTITHTSCEPGTISFQIGGMHDLKARYEARDGQVYTLKPARAGGAKVEPGPRTTAN